LSNGDFSSALIQTAPLTLISIVVGMKNVYFWIEIKALRLYYGMITDTTDNLISNLLV
jgi:hypothetical protein